MNQNKLYVGHMYMKFTVEFIKAIDYLYLKVPVAPMWPVNIRDMFDMEG